MMKLLCTAAVCCLVFATSTVHAQYIVDDGTAEAGLGIGGDSHIVHLNAFQAVAGQLTVNTIDIAFGNPAVAATDGAAIGYHLWTDPNNDGNPDDAQLFFSGTGTISSANTDTFVSFATPDFNLNVGDYFFVGYDSNTNGGGGANFTAARDTTNPVGQSWIAGNSDGVTDLDLNNLGGAGIAVAELSTIDPTFAGNWLIRADFTEPVPEPTSGFLLLGLGTVMLRRKR